MSLSHARARRPSGPLLLSACAAVLGLASGCPAEPSLGSPGSAASSSTGAGGGAACPPCVTEADCPMGERCAQFGGDTYCAPECGGGAVCSADRDCVTEPGSDGTQLEVCVPKSSDVCGTSAGPTSSSGASGSGGAADVCGSLHGPDATGCCTSCKTGNHQCQTNGCYGGWWCNVDTCTCQKPPGPCGMGSGEGGGGTGGNGGAVSGIDGGTLDTLGFAIVGDTRPASDDDTAGYPTAVIQKIWEDVEAHAPRPPFAITTGDYMFAKPYGSQAAPQLDLYLAARAAYSNLVFPALGNHECTGATASNCGQGNADGITTNYSTFLAKMLAPIGVSLPYYVVHVGSTTNAWTAKFVFIAANAWDGAQASWLASALAEPTTYTFVVRHEGTNATAAPGVTPTAALIAKHPYTLLIVGHTHKYAHHQGDKEVIVGNGGAPLSSGVNYGYVIARRRPDGAISVKAYDSSTNAVVDSFAVGADGSAAP